MANDLVIKLLGEDNTSPALRSATAGIRSYGNAVRSTMSRISRDAAEATAAVKTYVNNRQNAEIARMKSLADLRSKDNWDVLWQELNPPDEVQGMQHRQRSMENAAAMYEKSIGRMARALQKLNQDELESAAQSDMVLSRRITNEEQIINRSVGGRTRGPGGVSNRRQMMIQQSVFMLDDAIAGGTNGGIRGALLGASNNATMLAMMLGGIGTQLAVIGGVAALQIGIRMYESFRKVNDEAALSRTRLEEIQNRVDKIGTQPVRFRFIDEEVEGQSAKRLSRMAQEAQATEQLMKGSLTRLEEEFKQADSVLSNTFSPETKFNSPEERLNTQRQARQARDQITDRIVQAQNELRGAREFLSFITKNNSIAEAVKREEAEAAEKRQQEQDRANRAEQQRSKKIERGNRELDKLNKEREQFAMGIFGDQGREEGILSQMGLRLTKARELFGDRPQQLAEAERQITSITEEQIARLKLGDRSTSPLRSPSLAMIDSDRARAITLGAGNQARDAATRIDKHNNAMEKLTADIRDSIKEMVAEAKKDIDLVIDIAEN